MKFKKRTDVYLATPEMASSVSFPEMRLWPKGAANSLHTYDVTRGE